MKHIMNIVGLTHAIAATTPYLPSSAALSIWYVLLSFFHSMLVADGIFLRGVAVRNWQLGRAYPISLFVADSTHPCHFFSASRRTLPCRPSVTPNNPPTPSSDSVRRQPRGASQRFLSSTKTVSGR